LPVSGVAGALAVRATVSAIIPSAMMAANRVARLGADRHTRQAPSRPHPPPPPSGPKFVLLEPLPTAASPWPTERGERLLPTDGETARLAGDMAASRMPEPPLAGRCGVVRCIFAAPTPRAHTMKMNSQK
jgi:hypothetical protein